MKKKNIVLFVEDEQVVLNHYKAALERGGYQVLDALNGERGLELAYQLHPDIILLDLLLPKIDGMTLLRQLREDAWGKRVPVIIVTNLDSPTVVGEAAKLGVYEYLVKSQWSIDDVVMKVGVQLSRG